MEPKNDPRKWTRRELGRATAGLALTFAGASTAALEALADDSAKLVTEIPDNAGLLAGLQYVAESQKPGQKCGNCTFYREGNGEVGKCNLLVKGLVQDGAWCISWSPAASE